MKIISVVGTAELGGSFDLRKQTFSRALNDLTDKLNAQSQDIVKIISSFTYQDEHAVYVASVIEVNEPKVVKKLGSKGE